MTDDAKFGRGVADFNSGKFFEAHEVWEELWLTAAEPEKTFLQGLIQVAAAFHHHGRGNARGTQSLLAAGIAKLARCPDDFRGLAIAALRKEAEQWVAMLRSEKEPGPSSPPKIQAARLARKRNAADGIVIVSPRERYQPLPPKMKDPTICHYCHERPFVAGLALPNGVQVCQVCYDRRVAKHRKEKLSAGVKKGKSTL